MSEPKHKWKRYPNEPGYSSVHKCQSCHLVRKTRYEQRGPRIVWITEYYRLDKPTIPFTHVQPCGPYIPLVPNPPI